MSLGILESHEFESKIERYEMHFGDRLVAFSDGVVELENEQNEMLGDEGIEKWLQSQPDINAEGVINKAIEYLGGMQRNDDVTVVIFTSQPFEPAVNKGLASKTPIRSKLSLN